MSNPQGERDEHRRQQLTDLHDRLTTAVEDLATSDVWRRLLTIAVKMPTYSPNNILLITVQRPDAAHVAGYQAWRALGRHVRKGETGIAILAPCLYREPAPAGPVVESSAASADDTRDAGQMLRGFRVAHVFDITQTDGPDLPAQPQLLAGPSPTGLWDQLAILATDDAFTLERGPCGTANGYTDFANRTIRIRADVADLQAAKTLAHEIGHVRADHQTRFADTYHQSPRCRGLAEVEAESIAYIVLGASGIDTTDYSLHYITGWSNAETSLLRDTANRVLTVASRIVDDLQPPYLVDAVAEAVDCTVIHASTLAAGPAR